MDTANEFFVRELQDMYSAERMALRMLSEIEQQARRSEIKRFVARHRRQTEGQIKRLDLIFRAIGAQPSERTCEGVVGLLQEKRAVENERLSPELIDFNALTAALKFERYEISAYESLIFLAQQLKKPVAVRLLKATLKEEQDTAKLILEHIKKTRMEWLAGAMEERAGARAGKARATARRKARRRVIGAVATARALRAATGSAEGKARPRRRTAAEPIAEQARARARRRKAA